MAKRNIPPNLQKWIEARRRFGLSHAHIQMARELGMNPRKFGGLANHKQEPWKAPLPEFIEELYFKAFGKTRPDCVRSIEATADHVAAKKAARRNRKRQKRLEKEGTSQDSPATTEALPPIERLTDPEELPF